MSVPAKRNRYRFYVENPAGLLSVTDVHHLCGWLFSHL